MKYVFLNLFSKSIIHVITPKPILLIGFIIKYSLIEFSLIPLNFSMFSFFKFVNNKTISMN